MNTHLKSAWLIASVAAISSGLSSAQAEPSRTQVKAETRAAAKAGQLVPAGEGPIVWQPSTKSTKTRSERKAETLQARAAGDLLPAGPAAGLKEERREYSRPSTVNRADRKADTRAAEKAGTLVPAGEGPGSPTK